MPASLRRVTSVTDAAEFLSWLSERRPVLAVDTETGGLEYWRQPLRLVQFGDGETGWALSYRNWRGVIDQALASYAGPVAFHNAPFDLHFLSAHDLPTPGRHQVHDTKILDSLLYPGESHSLKPIGTRMFGEGAAAEQDVLKTAMAKNEWGWADIPEDYEPYWLYAAKDTVLTAQVAEHHLSRLDPRLTAAYEVEMAVQGIMYRAETRGMRVDVAYTEALLWEWEQEMDALRDAVPEFDITQVPPLVSVMLMDGWQPADYTPTGRVKFDADIRDSLDDPLARMHSRYKRLEKWTAAYLRRFLGERDSRDLIHARINTIQALTGRMSITEPALQTLPRGPQIRNCVLPYEGEDLWNIDYSTMEMRMFAHFSQDPALLRAGLEGLDFHKYTASLVYGVPIEEVTSNQRALAKQSVSFGKLYGAGPDKVAAAAKTTLAAVEEFGRVYAEQFPGVERFMRQLMDVGAERRAKEGTPYVVSWGGRRIPQTDGRLYALTNYLIQGSCADLFKRKIIEVDAAGYGEHIILPVHDSLLFSLPPEMADEVPKIQEIMEAHDEFRVPFTVDVSGPLERWGAEEAH